MARKPSNTAPVAPAPAPVIQNAAPGYDPYARGPAPASGVTAPGGPYGGPAPGGNGAAVITPPPSREDQSEFINATFLWKFGHPIRATIINVRDATGTGRDFGNQSKRLKRAWFIDFKLAETDPVSGDDEATGRINEGDTRHSKLWAAYQDKWINRTVTLRLTNPGDIDPMSNKPSKAAWMLDCN